jgi:hypothetical protein
LLKLTSRPTAIFARNDNTALGVLQALRERGCAVPEEVSVAGFDDIPLARQLTPPLTTISQPTEHQGRLAAEFLIGRIERPSEDSAPCRIVLECNLIVRGSTAEPAGRKTGGVASARTGRREAGCPALSIDGCGASGIGACAVSGASLRKTLPAAPARSR